MRFSCEGEHASGFSYYQVLNSRHFSEFSEVTACARRELSDTPAIGAMYQEHCWQEGHNTALTLGIIGWPFQNSLRQFRANWFYIFEVCHCCVLNVRESTYAYQHSGRLLEGGNGSHASCQCHCRLSRGSHVSPAASRPVQHTRQHIGLAVAHLDRRM